MSWAFFVNHYDKADQAGRDPKFRSDRGGVLYPRCATVGGCTAHNAMIIVRPNDSDWNTIAEMTGDTSWAAETMGDYFARLERCLYLGLAGSVDDDTRPGRMLARIPLLRRLVRANGHGADGWLPTSLANPFLLTRDLILLWVVLKATATQLKHLLGRPLHWHERIWGLFDPNDIRAQAQSMQGMWLIPQAVEKGHRNGTREALRTATAAGAPLTVLTDTLATRLNIDADGRCTGVDLPTRAQPLPRRPPSPGEPGEEITVTARHEVIVVWRRLQHPPTAPAVRHRTSRGAATPRHRRCRRLPRCRRQPARPLRGRRRHRADQQVHPRQRWPLPPPDPATTPPTHCSPSGNAKAAAPTPPTAACWP